ncbi:hypothetical protein ACLB2K_028171 [Fragaria x ananassa]
MLKDDRTQKHRALVAIRSSVEPERTKIRNHKSSKLKESNYTSVNIRTKGNRGPHLKRCRRTQKNSSSSENSRIDARKFADVGGSTGSKNPETHQTDSNSETKYTNMYSMTRGINFIPYEAQTVARVAGNGQERGTVARRNSFLSRQLN